MLGPNPLKEALRRGRRQFGVWAALANPTVNEALAAAGYDFIVHDNEHGIAGLPETLAQLQALGGRAVASLVRVPWNDPVYLKRALDLGVESVMIPMIESAEQARAAVAACRYPPAGTRGSGPWRAHGIGIDIDEYVRTANERLLVICQIESVKGVANVDAIAAVDGVDALFIGPNDLSGSVGHFRAFDHPEVRRAIDAAFAGIRRAGKPAGIVPHGSRSAAELFREGYALLAASTDLSLLHRAAKAEIEAVRAALG